MKEVRAYEAEGKLFKSEIEAREYTLEVGLHRTFKSRDGYQILSSIINGKDVRKELVRLIQEFDKSETESGSAQKLDFVRGIVENVTHRNISDVNSMNEYQAIQALSEFFNPRGEEE